MKLDELDELEEGFVLDMITENSKDFEKDDDDNVRDATKADFASF